MTRNGDYTTDLTAGLGVLAETRILVEIWQPGMTAATLYQTALKSGRFPRLSSRRVKNLVVECFARRFLVDEGTPARWLQKIAPRLGPREFDQVAFICTCRANKVLNDFVAEVYWPRYASGQDRISNEEARAFVLRANQEGRTAKPWSVSTIRHVAGYLTGTCADFGLLENGVRRTRKILPFRIEPGVAAVLAYDLHFAGRGDNAVVADTDWKLFGLEHHEVVAELKRLSLKGLLIVQAAGNVIRIGWKYSNLEELAHVLSPG
jgi:hypothetical protein